MIQSHVKVGRTYIPKPEKNFGDGHVIKVHKIGMMNERPLGRPEVFIFYHFYNGDRRETYWQPEWEFCEEYIVPKFPTAIQFKENAERFM